MNRLLAIDFAPRRWRITAAAAILLALILVGAGVWIVLSAAALERIARADAELATMHRTHARAITSRERAARSLITVERARAVNDAIRRLNLPWDALLAALDAAATPQVALLTLEPDAAAGVMRLTGEAQSMEAMLALQRRLQDQPDVASAVLTQHEVQSDSPGTPVRFSIDAHWRTRP
jgi:hypothetical protein